MGNIVWLVVKAASHALKNKFSDKVQYVNKMLQSKEKKMNYISSVSRNQKHVLISNTN